jgi:hypothetical protein
MPPRRSARVAGVAERATTALSPLPLAIVLHIFSLLPVDCRLRCLEVCRGWRAVLSERSLWTRLDLSATSGVRVPQRLEGSWDALLRCAAARAGGGLLTLHTELNVVTHQALLAVAAANASALRELHASDDELYIGLTPEQMEALLVAAPQLRVFATNLYTVYRVVQAARRALRNEAPFGPLRVRHLHANLVNEDEAGVVAFAADVAAHASLAGLSLQFARLHTPAALDAVVDAALARRMQSVTLDMCSLSSASAPALARLLSSDALTTLKCIQTARLLDAPAAAVLAAALRANATLTSLTLTNADVWHAPTAAAELLGALTGHASLRVLCLGGNGVIAAHQAAAGTALGALIAANASALTELDVSRSGLGDDGLRPLFEALPHNTHLQKLNGCINFVTEAFGLVVALPAVRANVSLREVYIDADGDAAAGIARELRSRVQQ